MEVLRKAVHSLEGNAPLRDLISEENDVVKVYEQLKKKDDSIKFFLKWAETAGPEYKTLAISLQGHNTVHSTIINNFCAKYRKWIQVLKEILALYEKLGTAEKHVKDVQEKVHKKKATDAELTSANEARDRISTELETLKGASIKEGVKNLTKAYCEMYQAALQEMNKQLAELDSQNPQKAPEKKEEKAPEKKEEKAPEKVEEKAPEKEEEKAPEKEEEKAPEKEEK